MVGGDAEDGRRGVNKVVNECWGHGLYDFGNGHPISDFVGEPGVVFGVPHFKQRNIPSNDLHSFLVSNHHGLAVFGHSVLGSYPGHGLGVFGLEDSSEQGPVHSPRRNGFGAVGAVARHALLADVDLPAAEIGGGWFHGLGVNGLEKFVFTASIGLDFYLRPESVGAR